ncbi:MAG: carboxypeptidase-like regulatory domain-containing protein [Vicinamibacterales bacterium]
MRGVVFDSVAGAPLAGAVVQVTSAPSGAGPDSARRLFSAVADSAGRYTVSGLVPGHYVIGFQHDALLALGIDSPLRSFDVVGTETVSIDLATPSAAVLRAVRCGAGDPQRIGMLSGSVTDARTGTLPGGGSVEVQWTEIGVRNKKLRAVPFSVRANIEEDGSYLACSLTTEAVLSVRVAALGHRTLNGELIVPNSGVLRRDFTLADTASTTGKSRLAGRVLLSDGKPLPSGQAIIATLSVEVPVTDGQFSMPGLPAGTWVVDVRALGYEPQSALVDVAEGAPAVVTLRLNTRAQVLDAVTVVGKSNKKEIGVLLGIQERSRMGSGTVFLAGSDALRTALVPADVVRFARGFRYLSPTVVFGRNGSMVSDTPHMICADARCATMVPDASVVGHTFNNQPCTSDREGAKKRYVVLYLDGLRFNGGLDMLNTTIAMNEVLAIETYPDVGNAPPEWRTPDACAVIAVWRKTAP